MEHEDETLSEGNKLFLKIKIMLPERICAMEAGVAK